MQQQQQYQPIHADRHGSSFNLTLIIALVVLAMGILIAQDPLMVAVGLGVAAFSWLTTPGQYTLYADRLVIAYGWPRIRHVLYRDVEEVQMLKFAFGARVLVRLLKGRVILQPRDAEEFESRFQGALESYFQEHGRPPRQGEEQQAQPQGDPQQQPQAQGEPQQPQAQGEPQQPQAQVEPPPQQPADQEEQPPRDRDSWPSRE